jgi:predicted amidohydrolase YtcJ
MKPPMRKENSMQNLFTAGKVYTGNPEQPWAEAILVENGIIKAVGTNTELEAMTAGKAEVTELGGKLVLPGFTDSHCHFVKRGLTLTYVDLKLAQSIDDCRIKIQTAVEQSDKGTWILGFGWNEYMWSDDRSPDISDLDDISPDNPVMLNRACCHSVWVNSLALQLAGIDHTAVHPPGGLIEKDEATGAPTGIIKEARYLIEDHIPQPSVDELKAAAKGAQEEVLKYGITAVHSNESLREHDILKTLEDDALLHVRVLHSFPPTELGLAIERKLTPDTGSDHLWYRHIKLFADGSLGAKTAYMHEAYENESSCGLPFLAQEELAEKVASAHSHGFGVSIHAIGDKAVSNSLDAIADSKNKENSSINDRIEHIQLFKTSDLTRFVEYGVFASVQPIFLSSDMQLAEKVWGMERCQNAYAWKTLLDAGIPAVFGSDSPIEPCNPLLGIHAAVNRTRITQDPVDNWFPEQALTIEESIKGFTLTPAILAGKEQIAGSLEPGKLADFTVLSDDIFGIEKEKIKDITCEMTICGGEIVYRTGEM